MADAQIHLSIEEQDGKWVLRTDLYDHLPKMENALIHTDMLGEAFEPEQKFEAPNGSAIVFGTDCFGAIPSAILAGPFAQSPKAEQLV